MNFSYYVSNGGRNLKFNKLSLLLGFVLGIVILLVCSILLGAFPLRLLSPSLADWLVLVETIVLAITFVALIIQLRLQGRDIHEQINANQVSTFLEISKILSTDDARKDREYIYCDMPDISEKRLLPKEDWAKANRVWTSFDHVGLLIERGLINEEIVMEEWCETIIKCWDKLKDYINQQREMRGGRYQKYFELLTTRAREYHKKHYPNEQIKYFKKEEQRGFFV